MIYKHGSESYDVHVASVDRIPEWNALDQLIRSTTRIRISGVVKGSTQAAIKTAVTDLETNFVDSRVTTSGLMHSDGTTRSGHFIDTVGADTERGIQARVRWTSPINRAEYVFNRSFEIIVECAFLGIGAEELQLSNRIVRIGNGAAPKVVRNTQGGPLIQNPYPSSPFLGFETGQKVSRLGIVTVSAPTFPALLRGDTQRLDTGSDRGPEGVTRFFATWVYEYVSLTSF